MTLPTFIVLGAGRSGTTSLHHALSRHPEIYMTPTKSPNFFVAQEPVPDWEGPVARQMAAHWVRDRHAYEALFDGVTDELAIGEVSPLYLQATGAAAAIHALCPDVRLVAILRHPVDRAYAHFLGRRRDGIEARSDFGAVVAQERSRPLPDRVAFGHYLGCGRYHHFLRPYYDVFPSERIRVLLFEDLAGDPAHALADILGFLGVDSEVALDLGHRAQTGEIENRLLRAAWTRSVRARSALRPHLPARVRDRGGAVFLRRLGREALPHELRRELLEVFREDIERLQPLIGRDLSAWLA
jgi:hypothetical protein